MNSWINHIKNYSTNHNMKYNEALKNSDCKASYKKHSGSGVLFSLFNRDHDREEKLDRQYSEENDSTKEKLQAYRNLRTAYKKLNTLNEGTLEYRKQLQVISNMKRDMGNKYGVYFD